MAAVTRQADTAREANQPNSRRTLWLVLCLGLVARLFALSMAVAQHGAKWLFTRGVEVGFVANSLLTGHGFSSPFGGSTGPTALIAPGYPLLVTFAFKVFGAYSTTAAVVIMLTQVSLNLATIALVMHLAKRFADDRAALIAGIFWACWPPLLWMPTIFWETSISACALVGMIAFALRLRAQPTLRLWVLFGALAGAIALTNMALLITLCAIFMWLVFVVTSRQRSQIAFSALLFLVVFAAWPVRNARVFHAFVPLRTTVGLELSMGNHDGASGYLEEAMFPIYNSAELNRYISVGELAYDHEQSVTAHKWIAAHPAAFLKLTSLRFLRFWVGSGSRNGSFIFVLGAITTTLCGLWGLGTLYRSRQYPLAVLFTIPLILFPLPYYITHAEFRYRLVLDPVLTLLSSYALTQHLRAKSLDEKTHPQRQLTALGNNS